MSDQRSVYERRKEDVEQEGSEYAPLAKVLFHIVVPTASDTFCITRIHSISTVGVGKEGRIQNWFTMKSEKAARVTGTALRTTGPICQWTLSPERHRLQVSDPIKLGLTRWRLEVYVNAFAEIGRNIASKHQIQPECGEWAG